LCVNDAFTPAPYAKSLFRRDYGTAPGPASSQKFAQLRMHFFYLDESGCGGGNLADGQEPIFVLGGISVTDEGWRTTMEQFNQAFDDFFGRERPPADV
jgi:hypothetical protein